MNNNDEFIDEFDETEDEDIDIDIDADGEETEDDGDTSVESTEKTTNLLGEIIEIAESTLTTIFVVILLFTYILHPVNIIGSSMEPTLMPEDRVFMTTVMFNISYGDIVIIENDHAYLLNETGAVMETSSEPLNECIIKRVIAKGGQTVDIDYETGRVVIDGVPKDEPFVKELIAGTQYGLDAFNYPITVPDGYYFVMGDNRNNSADSRHRAVGLIKRGQIYGRAIMRYSPLSEIKIFW